MVSTVENSASTGEAVAGLLLFPFLVWGPLLGAAVVAYRLRRARPQPQPDRGLRPAPA